MCLCVAVKEGVDVNVEWQRSHNHSLVDCPRLDRSSLSLDRSPDISDAPQTFCPASNHTPGWLKWDGSSNSLWIKIKADNRRKLERGQTPEDEDMLLVCPLLILLDHNQSQLLLLKI